MNYKLKVETCNIDKVVHQLSEKDITIRNVLRAAGVILIKTKLINEVKMISEVIEVKKESFLPQLLIF